MVTLLLVLILAAAIIAILSAVKPLPILWIAVLLLALVEAVEHVQGGLMR
jgi:hypothetical protein